jgi:hypothetical protein
VEGNDLVFRGHVALDTLSISEKIAARRTGVANNFAQEVGADHVVERNGCWWSMWMMQPHVITGDTYPDVSVSLQLFYGFGSGDARYARHTLHGDDVHTDIGGVDVRTIHDASFGRLPYVRERLFHAPALAVAAGKRWVGGDEQAVCLARQ